MHLWYHNHSRGRGSVGRAQPCQGWGRGFEPRRPLHFFIRRHGQVVRQRPAKPLSPVRIRMSPPENKYRRINMKNIIKEFREFINQGNAMDLAVAVVIGAAFTAIVTSIVNDLIMPIISLVTGGIDFSEMKVVIGEGQNAAAFCYGNFISAVIQFFLIAIIVFLIIRLINRIKRLAHLEKPKEEAPTCPFCLEEIKAGASRCPHCAGEIKKSTKKQ